MATKYWQQKIFFNEGVLIAKIFCENQEKLLFLRPHSHTPVVYGNMIYKNDYATKQS